jgi:hypothetical protein
VRTTKEAILEMIRKLPDNVTLADVMAELYFRQKVDQGLSPQAGREEVSAPPGTPVNRG